MSKSLNRPASCIKAWGSLEPHIPFCFLLSISHYKWQIQSSYRNSFQFSRYNFRNSFLECWLFVSGVLSSFTIIANVSLSFLVFFAFFYFFKYNFLVTRGIGVYLWGLALAFLHSGLVMLMSCRCTKTWAKFAMDLK